MDFQSMLEKEKLLDKRLKACLHRTFAMNDDIRRCENERASCEAALSKKELNHDQSCLEKSFAMDIKQIMKKMEMKRKQKQIFHADWNEIHTDLATIIESIRKIQPKSKSTKMKKSKRVSKNKK
jgi:hypothetical protein